MSMKIHLHGACLVTLAALSFSPSCESAAKEKAPATLSGDARRHVETMAAEAREIQRLLDNAAPAGNAEPISVQLALDWAEKQYECDLMLNSGAKGVLLEQYSRRVSGILQNVERRPGAPAASLNMARYGVAEVALLRAIEAKSASDQRQARGEMGSAAPHVYASLVESTDARVRTVEGRTLKAKWLWRAANAAIVSTPPELSPETTAREWIRIAGAGTTGGSGIEAFSAARMRSLQAAMRDDSAAVRREAAAMAAASREVVESMQRAGVPITPEGTQAFVDWSKKWMESEELLDSGQQARRKATDDHAGRIRSEASRSESNPGRNEISKHIVSFAIAEAEHLQTTLR